MRGIEVLKALEYGKKVRVIDWVDGHYVYLENNIVIDDEGKESIALLKLYEKEWELYDGRKKLPKQLEWLKSFYNMHITDECDLEIEDHCQGCPLHNQTFCKSITEMAKELNKEYKLD